MNRFIEKLHSLFFCNAEMVLWCSEYVYISPCDILLACAFRSDYSYVWMKSRLQNSVPIAFHLSAVSYKHSFTQFIQVVFLSGFSSFYLSSYSSVLNTICYHKEPHVRLGHMSTWWHFRTFHCFLSSFLRLSLSVLASFLSALLVLPYRQLCNVGHWIHIWNINFGNGRMVEHTNSLPVGVSGFAM